MRQKDDDKLDELILRAASAANGGLGLGGAGPAAPAGWCSSLGADPSDARHAFELARRGGTEMTLRFDHLVQILGASDSDDLLLAINPFLGRADAARALDSTALALLTANRIGQLTRCLEETRGLGALVPTLQQPLTGGAPSEGARKAAQSKADALAASLVAGRHYMRVAQGSAGGADAAEFDPRLLLFEFAHDLLLREAQVPCRRRVSIRAAPACAASSPARRRYC